MSCKIICIIALVFFGCCLGNARVFYVDERDNNPRINNGYPMYPPEGGGEQASRDLDLSFTAGDPPDYPDDRTIVYPARKIYAYATPRKPVVDMRREYERPVPYYEKFDVPTRRIMYGDQYPVSERTRKPVRLDNGPLNGEVVLELRVIANNNNNAV